MGAKQKKEYVLDKDGNKIYDPKKRQYKCKSVPATDWNEQTKAEEWRAAWAEICNSYLEKGNHTERIDHRSYERQGIDLIPTVASGRSRLSDGEARDTHRAGKHQPRNRSHKSEAAAVESPHFRAAKLAERGSGEHRAAHSCRGDTGYPFAAGADGKARAVMPPSTI